MRWMRGAVLMAGLTGAAIGGNAPAQQKPPPLGQPAPEAKSPAGPGLDKFGEPIPGTTLPAPAPPAAAAPGDELPGIARFRAMLGPTFTLSYRAAERIDPAGGSVRLLGAMLARDGTSTAIEELTLDGLGEDRIGAASARDVAFTGGDGSITRVARLELRGLAAPQGGSPAALAMDQLRLEALTVEGDNPVAVAEIAVEDYVAGRPGRLTITGVEVLTPQLGAAGRVRLGRLALRGLDLPGTVAAMAAEQTPPRALGGYALEAEDLAVLDGDRLVGGAGALRIQGEPPDGTIEVGRVALRELRFEAAADLGGWLRRFDYPSLVADLTAESRYDRATGRLELNPLSLAGREMGVLGLSLTLDGMTAEAMEAKDWERLSLAGLTLRYLDQSLYGRAVRDQARRMRVPEARVREQWSSQIAGALSAGGVPGRGPGGGTARAPGALAPVTAALQRFLRAEAREVEITISPPRPLPLGELPPMLMGRSPGEVQQVLGLGATAR